MELILIGIVTFFVSGLTLYSGFGLGTVLMPVFAVFFPVPLAIAATAVVHFLNNLFKLGLMAKDTNWQVVLRFGIPAAVAAVVGAITLNLFNNMPVMTHYTIGNVAFEITVVKTVIGTLIVLFSLLELWPRFQALAFPARWLPVGGALSGFFGGLSGNQGALRSAFLIKAGLSKEAFIATAVVCTIIVDAVRLTVYGTTILENPVSESRTMLMLILIASICAFLGTWVAKQILHKITLRTVQFIVAIGMLIVGVGLIFGLI
jgi:uncharacterized membrane protein YfcA